jgi:putative glutamine amidotransferase
MTTKAALTFRYKHKAEPYADAMREAGIEPVLISPDAPATLEGLQGLLLSGGDDLNPSLYGAAPYAGNDPPDDERDALEAGLLRQALDRDLPLLALCRGMQLCNVVHGGTLVQHLDTSNLHQISDGDHALPVHEIQIEPGTRLAAILGDGRHPGNSRHHQAVERCGRGLRISARSVPDGVIEGVERDDRAFAVAVQWHPEDQATRDATQRKLFAAFGEALQAARLRL